MPTPSAQCSFWEGAAVVLGLVVCPITALLCLDAIGVLVVALVVAPAVPVVAPPAYGAMIGMVLATCAAALASCGGLVLAAESCGDDAAAEKGRQEMEKMQNQIDEMLERLNDHETPFDETLLEELRRLVRFPTIEV